jgi:glycosyltransferase involved in cell wall biosynthesis
MNVLFVNFRNDSSSALLRTSEALKISEIQVHYFRLKSFVKEDFSINLSKINRVVFYVLFFIDLFITRVVYKRTRMFFSRNFNLFANFCAASFKGVFKKYDLVHIHWVGHGFISTEFLLKLNLDKIVITFHDFYFITGGCHVPDQCLKYIEECKNCPAGVCFKDFQLGNFNEKKEFFSTLKVYALAPSNAMASKIKNSHLGRMMRNISVIPNAIDTDLYKPFSELSRFEKYVSLVDSRSKFILFVANDLSDTNKGLDILIEALNSIECNEKICLLLVGERVPFYIENLKIDFVHLGKVDNVANLVEVYNLAYITVVPSRFESFSQVTVESMSCGTPVVAFDSSGPAEIISPNIDGLLATSFAAEDLGIKINLLVENVELRNLFSINGRFAILEKYGFEAVGRMLKNHYMRIINDE